jgi:hypothetical protein
MRIAQLKPGVKLIMAVNIPMRASVNFWIGNQYALLSKNMSNVQTCLQRSAPNDIAIFYFTLWRSSFPLKYNASEYRLQTHLQM